MRRERRSVLIGLLTAALLLLASVTLAGALTDEPLYAVFANGIFAPPTEWRP